MWYVSYAFYVIICSRNWTYGTNNKIYIIYYVQKFENQTLSKYIKYIIYQIDFVIVLIIRCREGLYYIRNRMSKSKIKKQTQY